MSETPLLRVTDLSKAFGGVQAVNRVSFDLNKGDLLGIIGPNGSGKTTTVNLITGFVKASGGRSSLKDRRSRAGRLIKSCVSASQEPFRW